MAARNQPILGLAEVVRILRQEVERAGSQAEWARRTGVSRPNLNSTITGKRPPTRDVLRALSLKKVFAYQKDSKGRARSR
jgi:DNA-binding phage protein